MKSDKKIANAVSGRTARACDCCIRRRARWYCTADDAFLCQTCDLSVHSANPLARRHQRVRLKTASTSLKRVDPLDLPSWQRGLTRKARTPRHGKHPGLLHHQGSKYEDSTGQNPLRIVPELGAEDTTCSHEDENDDQLLYRVPIFDPFVPELCTSTTSTPVMEVESFGDVKSHDVKSCFQPLDMDLEEFAADVETLLGKGLDEESYGIEELGLLNSCENSRDMEDRINFNFGYGGVVKAENNDQLRDDVGGEEFALRDPCNLGFDVYGEEFATTCQDYQEDQKVMKVESIMAGEDRHGFSKLKEDDDEKDRELVKKRKISLTLDYEAISEAWASQSQSSPWINGQRPDFNPDDCWLHGLGTSGMELEHPLFGGRGGHGGVMGDGGREARVLRYREKRRTRLFAKKIRYEVRKLNAEKRPRMKGRFVKRSSFPHPPTTTAPVALLSK